MTCKTCYRKPWKKLQAFWIVAQARFRKPRFLVDSVAYLWKNTSTACYLNAHSHSVCFYGFITDVMANLVCFHMCCLQRWQCSLWILSVNTESASHPLACVSPFVPSCVFVVKRFWSPSINSVKLSGKIKSRLKPVFQCFEKQKDGNRGRIC